MFDEKIYFDNLDEAKDYLLDEMMDQEDVDNLYHTYHYADPDLSIDYKNKIVKEELNKINDKHIDSLNFLGASFFRDYFGRKY